MRPLREKTGVHNYLVRYENIIQDCIMSLCTMAFFLYSVTTQTNCSTVIIIIIKIKIIVCI